MEDGPRFRPVFTAPECLRWKPMQRRWKRKADALVASGLARSKIQERGVVMAIIIEERVPPLAAGDNLTREEFMRRWAAQPRIKLAELIDGVVYMPSPVSVEHGDLGQVLRHLQEGLDSAEHRQFAAELSARRDHRDR
jgi:hypothetical protein